MEIETENGEKMELNDSVFGREYNETLVHQVVVAYLAGSRAGTKGQKGRGTVSHTTAKPWRQKGTGRARAGMSSSPLWRSGGVTFAAETRDYSKKVNKKMYRAAMSVIFSELVRSGRLVVSDSIVVDQIKTKQALEKLDRLGISRGLILTDGHDEKLDKSIRNVPNLAVCDVSHVDPVSLIRFDKVLMTGSALKRVEEWLA